MGMRHKICVQMLNIKTSGILLDIGCGDGGVTSIVDNDKTFYIGIDINLQKLKELKLKLKKTYQHDYELIVSDASKIPLKEESVKNVSMLEVLEHIPKSLESKTILEVRRVLQSKGKVVISTGAQNFLACFLDPAFLFSKHRHYTKNYLDLILINASFRITKSEQHGYVIQALCMLIFYTMNIKNYLNNKRNKKINIHNSLWNLADRDYVKQRNNGFTIMILAEKQ